MSILGSLFGKETLVGIDIGSSAIKMVQTEAYRGGFRVTRAAIQKTPPGTVRDGMVLSPEAVAMAISQAMETGGIVANTAALSISGPAVAVRQIRVPRMNESALARSIRYEAAKHIPTNLDESSLAFEIQGPAEDDPSQMDTMLVAAPRDLVESRVSAAFIAGLETASVDVEAFAAQRAVFELNRDEFADDTLRALVDIGAGHTEVTLLSGSRFVLTRSVPIAGDTFTDALKNHYRTDAGEGESRKHEVDMSILVSGDGAPEATERAHIVQAAVDELLREIRRSIHYFQSQLSETGQTINLSEILLVGGSSQMRGLPEFVVARLGIQARVLDPFSSPGIYVGTPAENLVQEQGPALGIALGLALKEPMGRAFGGKR